ncbi:hypothetical protein QBC34DRAFT_74672 [Podospora aff. communis PSN243]|uniref:Uncharacterized protein n=1 Tax=Podospora aff. communis PSN243 TaxID=3040156 RepID=A0AAV9H5N6_9PEZI|nr:hypothetical protein QBC34DRAFT_74672 [Podospora aff. communis PSN243]
MEATGIGGLVAGVIVFLFLSVTCLTILIRYRHAHKHVPDQEQTTAPISLPMGSIPIQTTIHLRRTPKDPGPPNPTDQPSHAPRTHPTKCLVPPRQTHITRLGEYLNSRGYLNPAGEPWVSVPPPKIPLPERPNTPASLRSRSSSQLNLRSASSSRHNLRSSSLTQLYSAGNQQPCARLTVSPVPAMIPRPAAARQVNKKKITLHPTANH